ncbi:MAG: Si-specific NAD(P)(+) transhydrogenase [Alphaproteobacteria bacterium]|nr:Si-specific NAD(P)(+) transhydrogenase [Alphaproteobacteria bacterium]
MTAYDYDLFVIGSGPGGQRAAIAAAKAGKRVGVAERVSVVGGVCVNTGTIPSKSFREAALYLSGYRERGVYGASYTVKQRITMADLLYRTDWVIKREIDVIQHHFQRNGVDLFAAEAAFTDPHTLRLSSVDGSGMRDVTAAKIILAVGTTTARAPHIRFDGQRIFTSDDILTLRDVPTSLAVIGAGVIGCEYATTFAALGTRVTLIDQRPQLLDFVDREITDHLVYHMRQNRMTLRLGETVEGIESYDDGRGEHVRIALASGKQIVTQKALYAIGRSGAVGGLRLEAAGIEADARGRLNVDEQFRTNVDHVYAVGDVIGFPSLASTSMEQGRIAACHALGLGGEKMASHFPFGIYTIPEISMVGASEEELTDAGVPYEVGKASYREVSRGMILGDSSGFLKIAFHLETREILGVTIIGEGASELVHIGQAVMAHGGTIDYFVNNVFNYPTLAECYKNAAFDGINRLG